MWKCGVERTRIEVSLYTELSGQSVGHENGIKANMEDKCFDHKDRKALERSGVFIFF